MRSSRHGGSGAATAAEAPAEPVFIEIWRAGPPRPRAAPAAPAPAADARAAPTPTKPTGEVAAPIEGAPAVANGVGEARPATSPRHERHDRPERKEGDRPRHERKAGPRRDGKDGPRREGRDGPRRENGDRPRREPRSAEPMRFSTEPPKGDKRNKPIDPNSPFAALAALKAQLEGRKPEGPWRRSSALRFWFSGSVITPARRPASAP